MEDSRFIALSPSGTPTIAITTAGISNTHSGHTFGPAVRPYYLVHYILSGRGRFLVDGVAYELAAGQGFLITPGMETTYIADNDEPWSYVWIGFTGTIAADLVASTGLSLIEPIFSIADAEPLRAAVLPIINTPQATNADRLASLARLYDFLACIARADKSFHSAAISDECIHRAIGYIREHIAESITVQEIADFVGLERSWFTTRFQKVVGTSPGHYLQMLRLTLAKLTLESTRLPLEEIAFRCGYQSAEALSKAFRRQYGIAPGKYRQEARRYDGIAVDQLGKDK